MEFRVIGPVELWAGGRRRDLGTTKERCVLAVLLLSPRQSVPASSLISRVWDDNPPPKARQSLYSYITRLRHRLADLDGVELGSRQGTYRLDVEDEAVDLHRFALLRDQARAIAESGDGEYALEHYRRAAGLWRAIPLADLRGDWVERTRTNLEEQLLTATFERAELELRHGHHADLVGELTALAERYSYHERAVELLMVALFRSGRQAEALDAYRRIRAVLAQEVGTDPGPNLQRLHQRILRTDPELLRIPGSRFAARRRPDNLPPDERTFTGREEELDRLLAAVPGPAEPPPQAGPAATVLTIDGMPGVGKTALAVHLAHRLAGRFPDGAMFLDLRAHDAGQRPLDPAAALDALLRVAGVPAARIPRTTDERVALWRTRLAGARAVIVLDDATGHDQVRPLLPASAGSLVVVTSRRRLTGLHDSHPLSLDVLPLRDAMRLFTGIAGLGPAADPAGVAAVVGRCGQLPLAVRMAASRLRHRRAWGVADLLARLTSDDRRLEELRVEGREISVVFEISYRALPPALRDAFRTLALHPGPDLTAHAAAALLDRPVHESERVLEELLDRHLITEPTGGRHRFHDLVGDYARGLAAEDSAAVRRRATERLLDFYTEAAERADALLSGRRPPAAGPLRLPRLETEAQAREWLAAEHDCLLGAARHA
uniref:AfsR/SARP family transcriptional regulator n=1 Tax=Actinomadura roseirufa TaxID=2094049 RepID=UPI001A9558B9